jgi:hypothetical protein
MSNEQLTLFFTFRKPNHVFLPMPRTITKWITTDALCVPKIILATTCTMFIQAAQNVESSWNVMAFGDAREGKWGGNSPMEWVASTLHTTSEHGVSSITIADARIAAASSRLNWRPRRFKWTRPFRCRTKSGSCAGAITFQTQSNTRHHLIHRIVQSDLCHKPMIFIVDNL